MVRCLLRIRGMRYESRVVYSSITVDRPLLLLLHCFFSFAALWIGYFAMCAIHRQSFARPSIVIRPANDEVDSSIKLKSKVLRGTRHSPANDCSTDARRTRTHNEIRKSNEASFSTPYRSDQTTKHMLLLLWLLLPIRLGLSFLSIENFVMFTVADCAVCVWRMAIAKFCRQWRWPNHSFARSCN